MSEKLTFDQVNKQIRSAYMRRSAELPSVLVSRTDGRVTVGRVDTSTHKVYFNENGQDYSKRVSHEAMSDQVQEKLAEALAGMALRSQVEVSESRFAGMLDPDFDGDIASAAVKPKLDEMEIALLRRGLASARENVSDAQDRGSDEDSRYWQEVAGRYAKDLRDAGESL